MTRPFICTDCDETFEILNQDAVTIFCPICASHEDVIPLESPCQAIYEEDQVSE